MKVSCSESGAPYGDMWLLLSSVIACLNSVEQLNAAHLQFLESENCESDCGVANLGCLFHYRVLKKCRWVQA